MKCDRGRAFAAHEIENTFYFFFDKHNFRFSSTAITIADEITTTVLDILHRFIETLNDNALIKYDTLLLF